MQLPNTRPDELQSMLEEIKAVFESHEARQHMR